MSNMITVAGIDLIDSTGGSDGDKLFVLSDEQSASTVGIYTSEESFADGVEQLKALGRTSQEIWGEVYVANAFVTPSFSLPRSA